MPLGSDSFSTTVTPASGTTNMTSNVFGFIDGLIGVGLNVAGIPTTVQTTTTGATVLAPKPASTISTTTLLLVAAVVIYLVIRK